MTIKITKINKKKLKKKIEKKIENFDLKKMTTRSRMRFFFSL